MRISMELDSTEMMKRFVMAGLGVSFLAVSNCREEIAAGKLSRHFAGAGAMVRRLGLIYRKDKALSKAALGFIQVVLDNVGERRQARKRKTQSSAGGGLMTCTRCRKKLCGHRDRLPALRRGERQSRRHVPDIDRADLRGRLRPGLPLGG